MKQFNINITEDFEKDLQDYMKITNISIKVDAIRHALRNAVIRLKQNKENTDFTSWIGAGLTAELNHSPRFKSEDELW